MRKVTEKVGMAFNMSNECNMGNTVVKVVDGEVRMILLGSTIAIKDIATNKVKITNCGYFTNVTKDRLNSILGVMIVQIKGEWYLNGEKWDGKLIEL